MRTLGNRKPGGKCLMWSTHLKFCYERKHRIMRDYRRTYYIQRVVLDLHSRKDGLWTFLIAGLKIGLQDLALGFNT